MNGYFLCEMVFILGAAYFAAESRGHKGWWRFVYNAAAVLCTGLAFSAILAECYK